MFTESHTTRTGETPVSRLRLPFPAPTSPYVRSRTSRSPSAVRRLAGFLLFQFSTPRLANRPMDLAATPKATPPLNGFTFARLTLPMLNAAMSELANANVEGFPSMLKLRIESGAVNAEEAAGRVVVASFTPAKRSLLMKDPTSTSPMLPAERICVEVTAPPTVRSCSVIPVVPVRRMVAADRFLSTLSDRMERAVRAPASLPKWTLSRSPPKVAPHAGWAAPETEMFRPDPVMDQSPPTSDPFTVACPIEPAEMEAPKLPEERRALMVAAETFTNPPPLLSQSSTVSEAIAPGVERLSLLTWPRLITIGAAAAPMEIDPPLSPPEMSPSMSFSSEPLTVMPPISAVDFATSARSEPFTTMSSTTALGVRMVNTEAPVVPLRAMRAGSLAPLTNTAVPVPGPVSTSATFLPRESLYLATVPSEKVIVVTGASWMVPVALGLEIGAPWELASVSVNVRVPDAAEVGSRGT